MSTIKIGIIGIGGFARTHISSAFRCQEAGLCKVAAVVAPLPHNPAYHEAEREEKLRTLGARIYRSYPEMFEAERGHLQLVTVPLGIPLHAPVSIEALKSGFHVLCEKPAAGELAEALRMLEAQRTSRKILSIGFQHLLTPGIQALKAATLDGRYGRLLEARTIVGWPRDSKYYGRNEWAGRLTLGGRKVLDSPMQNAASHFLQNMLYVASASSDGVASPREVYAENYRANDIESADTQFARILTDTGVTLVFVASHALRLTSEPYSEFRFEKATLVWDTEQGARLLGEPASPAASDEAPTEELIHDLPLVDTLDAITEDRAPKSSIDNAIQHVACVEAAFASSEGVHEIPQGLRTRSERPADPQAGDEVGPGVLTAVTGMKELLVRCFESGRGPAELGVSWGRRGRAVRPASR